MEKQLRIYLTKYKSFLMPLIFFSASFFLVFRIILPQFSSISESKLQISQKQKDLDDAKLTYQTLSTLPDITDKISTATLALPTSKDFASMLAAVSEAISEADAMLEGFSIKVGGVYGKAVVQNAVSAEYPTLNLTVRITYSNALSAKLFAQSLQKKLPISEIKKISASASSGSVELSFYYKPISQVAISKIEKIPPFTPREQSLMEQLEGFR